MLGLLDAKSGFGLAFTAHLFLPVPVTNSELSNTSEPEDASEREQRPRGTSDERGARRGTRGRGANTGRGRGGPGSKPSNSISSGRREKKAKFLQYFKAAGITISHSTITFCTV